VQQERCACLKSLLDRFRFLDELWIKGRSHDILAFFSSLKPENAPSAPPAGHPFIPLPVLKAEEIRDRDSRDIRPKSHAPSSSPRSPTERSGFAASGRSDTPVTRRRFETPRMRHKENNGWRCENTS
jgi:hypothetical protein